MSITINTDIWGAPETWVDFNSSFGGKVANFPYIHWSSHPGTLLSGYKNGYLPFNEPLDDTICPWAIGKNSDLLKMRAVIPSRESTAPESVTVHLLDITPKEKRAAYPVTFTGGYVNVTTLKSRLCQNDNTLRNWCFDDDDWNLRFHPYQVNPLLNFDYKKICIIPTLIYASKSSVNSALANGYTTNEISLSSSNIEAFISNGWFDSNYIMGVRFPAITKGGNTSAVYRELDAGIIENGGFLGLDGVSEGGFADDFNYPFMPFLNGNTLHDNSVLGFDNKLCRSGEIRYGDYIAWGLNSAANNEDLYGSGDGFSPYVMSGSPDYWEYIGYFTATTGERNVISYFKLKVNSVDELRAYVYREAAYLGFMFSGWKGWHDNQSSTDFDANDGTEHIYLPIFDENGYTTGRYVTGNAATTENNYTWGNDVWEKTNYTGTPAGGDPNEYDTKNKTELNLQYTQMMMRFCKGYLLTKSQVDQLAVACYDIGSIIGSAPDILQEMLTKLFLKDGDPMDMIISLMFFPFNPAKYFVNVPQSEEIFFGAYPTGITAKRWDNLIVEIDMGSCTFYPTMGDSIDDFRNYQPYTTAELQLPYIGSVDIDPHIYLGHKISVKYVVDLCTGSCQALIYRDSLVVDQLSGHIGSAVSVKGVDQLEQLTAQQRAQANLKQARNTQISNIARMGITAAAAVGSVLTGGTLGVALGAGAIGGASNLIHSQNSTEQAEYEVDHIQTPYREIGHASSITAYRGEQFCRLIIKRPRMDATFSEESYAHSTGYATLRTATLSQFSGYTVCSSADLSGITATDQELNAIAAALRSGVYL